MSRKFVLPILLLSVAAAFAIWYARRDSAPAHYTGFVEGEERIIRSEIAGRVLTVHFAEGATVLPNAVLAELDDRDIRARIVSKEEEVAVTDAGIRTQTERIALVESTWKRDVGARQAELDQAQALAGLAERTLTRERELVQTGASTAQILDDRRAQRDQTRSALARTREMLARTEAEERSIALARHELDTLRQQRALLQAQLAELQVTRSKYTVRAPDATTVVQTQLIWPGELAQPGTAVVAVLDPQDKYVQIYVPVVDVGRFHVGRRVEIELDSRPGERLPGEISFIADSANFTPEKIETRSDRMEQVYRAKVRILAHLEQLQPGTEGNVYLGS